MADAPTTAMEILMRINGHALERMSMSTALNKVDNYDGFPSKTIPISRRVPLINRLFHKTVHHKSFHVMMDMILLQASQDDAISPVIRQG